MTNGKIDQLSKNLYDVAMSQRLAIIDHSFHQTTGSSQFMHKLLRRQFDVTVLWDTSWQGKKNITVEQLEAGQYDIIVFWQSILPVAELRRLSAQLVWAPMYDAVPLTNSGFWLELSTLPIKILAFSSQLATLVGNYGIDCLAVRYYPNPDEFPQITDYTTPRIFFWQRTILTYHRLKKILAQWPITSWLLKINPDPNQLVSRPSAADIAEHHITVLEEGYVDKTKYLTMLAQANVYICPRQAEGIGMSFLEAMAMGLIPIALNYPTMNEYIEDGSTGFLLKNDIPLPPPTSVTLTAMGQAIKTKMRLGYQRWQKQQIELLQWLPTPAKAARKNTTSCRSEIYLRTTLYYVRLVLNRLLRRFRTRSINTL